MSSRKSRETFGRLAKKIEAYLIDSGFGYDQEELENIAKVGREYAEVVLGFFGYQDRIVDDILYDKQVGDKKPEYSKGIRSVFNMLQDFGILTTTEEQTTTTFTTNGGTTYDTKEWRTNYWVLREDLEEKNQEVQIEKRSIYDTLPAGFWPGSRK